MSVAIITDSTCDLPEKQVQALGITVLPLTVIIDGKEYLDGITMTAEEFYIRQAASKELPTTSQVTVDAFTNAFTQALAAGHEVVCITLSSKLSGTYQSAVIAKQGLTSDSDKIHLVDSQSVTLALALLVQHACRRRDEGTAAAALVAELEALIPKLRLYAMIDTLKYLQKGGRLSAASAVMGTMLGIKPIIHIEDGEVKVFHKARGAKAALSWIVQHVEQSNHDIADKGASFGHSNAPEQMQALIQEAGKLAGKNPIQCCIGAVVGTHAGPGCTGMAFFEK